MQHKGLSGTYCESMLTHCKSFSDQRSHSS